MYRAGFARTQQAYEAAVIPLFDTLDWLEQRLARTPFVCGDRVTEADWRLFTTLVRFDPVYNGHFKCNLRRLVDYPNLWDYARSLYQVPGVAPTVDFGHIKRHYYMSHPWVNPTGTSSLPAPRWTGPRQAHATGLRWDGGRNRRPRLDVPNIRAGAPRKWWVMLGSNQRPAD